MIAVGHSREKFCFSPVYLIEFGWSAGSRLVSRDLQARNCEKRPELQGSNERTDAGRAM